MQGNTLQQLTNSPHLETFVKNHIHVGRQTATELSDGKHVHMWSGNYFMVRRQMGINKIADAPIQGLNMMASNGLIHAIGGALGLQCE